MPPGSPSSPVSPQEPSPHAAARADKRSRKIYVLWPMELVILVCLSGCATHRSLDQDARTYRDEGLPMAVRMAAFENVMARMTRGTPEKTVYRYLKPDTMSRIVDPKYGDTFSAHIDAPDGTERWITIHNGKVHHR